MRIINSLFDKETLEQNSSDGWQKAAFDAFKIKMTDKEKPFPCIPAVIGFSTNELRYGFLGDPREDNSSVKFADLLKTYTDASRSFGKYTSLIVFYETPADLQDISVEQYEEIFWEQLGKLASLDDMEWPHHIPRDPDHSLWEFCFFGEQYFMYCATPAHINRQSRNSHNMMLAITPRWVLQEFNKKPTVAGRIKTKIRKRLGNYDSIDIHPALHSYGELDNQEWKQYFLRDDETIPMKCPYHRVLKALGLYDVKKE